MLYLKDISRLNYLNYMDVNWLKSDYIRIEIRICSTGNAFAGLLKSDYIRIEMVKDF